MVDQDPQARKDARRCDRMMARHDLRSFTGIPRVATCGAVAVGNAVVFRKQGDSAGIAGLAVCGSTWVCPQCSARIAEHRRQDLHALLLAHRGRAGRALFLTLTMRHRKGQQLAELWDALMKAWERVQGHRVWRETIRPQLSGTARVTEVTNGEKGWHTHLHVLLFVDPSKSGTTEAMTSLAAQWSSVLFFRWSSALEALGYSAVPAAQDLRVLTGDPADTMADYFSKATFELARGDLKDAKFGNRTPFAILRDLLAVPRVDGQLDLTHPTVRRDLKLWREWEQASKGRRQWGWSKGLRAELLPLVDELTDDDIVDDDLMGEDVVQVANHVWSLHLKRFPMRQVRLLEVIEFAKTVEMARELVGQMLDSWLVPWEMPTGYRHRSQVRSSTLL